MTTLPTQKDKFKALLDDQHQWPGPYTFKFIVEQTRLPRVAALFPRETPIIRPSTKGTYVSVTFTVVVDSSDHVIAIYEQASQIDGIVSL